MKICSTCKQEKSLSEFDKASNRKDGHQVYCKECRKEKSRRYYTNNRQDIIDKSIARNKTVANYQWLRWKQFKETKECMVCGEDYGPCLDFHHIDPSTKRFTISDMVHQKAWATLMEEVEKCVCLCKCCHVKVHHDVIKLENYK